MKDEDATELDWFFLEVFSKMLFGPRYEVEKPVEIKKAPAETEA